MIAFLPTKTCHDLSARVSLLRFCKKWNVAINLLPYVVTISFCEPTCSHEEQLMTKQPLKNSDGAAAGVTKPAKRTYTPPYVVPMTPAAAKAVLEAKGNPEDPATKEILHRIEVLLKNGGMPE